jgi:hypothetical protein
MSLPNVDIQVQNGNLPGVIPTDDALCGLLIQGVNASSLNLLTPKLLTSLQDAVDVGIDEDYDTDNTVRAYKHIKEFYDEAGTGARLWIMLVGQAVSMESMVDKTEADYAVKLLDAADGKIRLLGVTRSPADGYSATVTNGIEADVEAALVTGQALAEEYQANYKPLRIVLEGWEYDEDAGNVVDLTAKEKNACAVVLGDTSSGAGSAVGLLLGRLAAIPVQRNVGRVKDGPLNVTAIYIGTETLAAAEGDIATLHGKGFITFRRYVGRSGYYFTDDPTCALATDDYRSLARGRVIDKAIVLAYATFVNEILDEVEIDANGRLATVVCKYYQSIIESAVDAAMTSNAEISSFSATIDPEQDVLTTEQIVVDARIVPVGYAKEIIVKLGFSNPATA